LGITNKVIEAIIKTKYNAIIIGSGIIGCSIAFELSKKGWKTLNVDKLAAAGLGSTANSCAVVRVHYSTLDGTAVAYESYQYWNDWANYLEVEDPTGIAEFHKRGVLVFKSQVNDNLKKVRSMMDELGIGYENWDFEKIKEKFPLLDDTSYYPARRPEDPDFGKKNESSLSGAIYYPEGGYISDPDDFNRNLTEQAKAQAYRLAQRIPDLRIPNQIQGVVDLYDVADDWIPIYDKSDLSGFYLAVGTSGNQYKTAPVVGKMMAELIVQCENGKDHDIDPVVFRLKHLKREVSMKFYSRLREINKESSFSVLG